LPRVHTTTCPPTRDHQKPQLHPYGASHEQSPSRMNITSPRRDNKPQLHPKGARYEHHKTQLHPKGASYEHNPAVPHEDPKEMLLKDITSPRRDNKSQLHPKGASFEHNKPRLHPMGASYEHNPAAPHTDLEKMPLMHFEDLKNRTEEKSQVHPTGASYEQHEHGGKNNIIDRTDLLKGNHRRLILLHKTCRYTRQITSMVHAAKGRKTPGSKTPTKGSAGVVTKGKRS